MNMYYSMYIGFLAGSIYLISGENSISCKNNDGDFTDGWTIIKFPDSIDYIYYEKNGAQYILHNSSAIGISLNDTVYGAMPYTLSQIWGEGIQYLIYNDENPIQVNYSFTVGHAKSVWAFSDDGGFVLQHSIPNFPFGPSIVSTYIGLPDSSWEYGQYLTCLSVNITQIAEMAEIAILIAPDIYDTQILSDAPSSIKDLASGMNSTDPICSYKDIYTISENKIIWFSKSAQWNNELWTECISPHFDTGLITETWIHGEVINSTCDGTYEIYNAAYMNFEEGSQSAYDSYTDHSKWAITLSASNTIVCFGDINRVYTQYTRGGGAFCWEDVDLWNILNKAVVNISKCK